MRVLRKISQKVPCFYVEAAMLTAIHWEGLLGSAERHFEFGTVRLGDGGNNEKRVSNKACKSVYLFLAMNVHYTTVLGRIDS